MNNNFLALLPGAHASACFNAGVHVACNAPQCVSSAEPSVHVAGAVAGVHVACNAPQCVSSAEPSVYVAGAAVTCHLRSRCCLGHSLCREQQRWGETRYVWKISSRAFTHTKPRVLAPTGRWDVAPEVTTLIAAWAWDILKWCGRETRT